MRWRGVIGAAMAWGLAAGLPAGTAAAADKPEALIVQGVYDLCIATRAAPAAVDQAARDRGWTPDVAENGNRYMGKKVAGGTLVMLHQERAETSDRGTHDIRLCTVGFIPDREEDEAPSAGLVAGLTGLVQHPPQEMGFQAWSWQDGPGGQRRFLTIDEKTGGYPGSDPAQPIYILMYDTEDSAWRVTFEAELP